MTSNTTPDHDSPNHDPVELGELERDVLSIVWRTRNVTAEQVREELDRPLKDSTVRTVLRRLEEKGDPAPTPQKPTVFYQPPPTPPQRTRRPPPRPPGLVCVGSRGRAPGGM